MTKSSFTCFFGHFILLPVYARVQLIKRLQLLEETEKSATTGIRESTSPSGSITTPDTWWHIIDENHLKKFPDDFSCFSLITIHPIELARQITLLTHDYIRETRLDELR